MENKLQELTDKLYNEGLSKGRQEAEALKAAAAKESEQIISDARKEAERILETARKEAEELRTRVEGDIRMASSQTISALRQQIENIIITKAVSPDVKAAGHHRGQGLQRSRSRTRRPGSHPARLHAERAGYMV